MQNSLVITVISDSEIDNSVHRCERIRLCRRARGYRASLVERIAEQARSTRKMILNALANENDELRELRREYKIKL